jgi:hypothetical protein
VYGLLGRDHELNVGLANGVRPTYTEFTSDKDIGPIDVCFPKGNGVSNDQVVRIVVKWLQDHPQELHKGAESLVVCALHDSFPCRAIPAR